VPIPAAHHQQSAISGEQQAVAADYPEARGTETPDGLPRQRVAMAIDPLGNTARGASKTSSITIAHDASLTRYLALALMLRTDRYNPKEAVGACMANHIHLR